MPRPGSGERVARRNGVAMMSGAGEGLKGRAARAGKPVSALDPLTRTRHRALVPFCGTARPATECHLYFAREGVISILPGQSWSGTGD